MEFGVASGRTLRFISETHPGRVYGFDSFEGLPEVWRPGFPAGAFAQNPPETTRNAELVIGRFDKTLPNFAALHREPISFLHIDCDLYSSTKIILDNLSDRIVTGTIIVFDEYIYYPGWRKHEYKAWKEFAIRKRLSFEYSGYVKENQQVSIIIT